MQRWRSRPLGSVGRAATRRAARAKGAHGRFRGAQIGNKTIQLPIVRGTEGERAIDIRKLRDETGLITLDPGYGNTGSCRERDHLHRRREGHPALPRLPDRGARREEHVPRGRLAADHGELPTRQQLDEFTHVDHAPHDAARGLPALLRRAAEGRAPDGRRARRRSARSPPSTPTRSTRATRARSRSPCTG